MYCGGGVNLTVRLSQHLQLKPVPTACQQTPAAAGSRSQLSADLAGQRNGMICKRRSSLSGSRQHDTSGTGMHPPLGPQRAWQQREPRAHAATAADLVGTAPGQACNAISSPDTLSVANDGYQLPRSHQQDSTACAAGSGNRPALLEASNPAKRLSLTANMAHRERQAESPDPVSNAALITLAAAAEGSGGIVSRHAGQAGAAADGAAVEDDAAGRLVQQCESIFSFL